MYSVLRTFTLCVLLQISSHHHVASGIPVGYGGFETYAGERGVRAFDPSSNVGRPDDGNNMELLTPMEEVQLLSAVGPQPEHRAEAMEDGASVVKRYGENTHTAYSAMLNRYRLYQMKQNMLRNIMMHQRDSQATANKRSSEGQLTGIWAALRQNELWRWRNEAYRQMLNPPRLRRTNQDPFWEIRKAT